MTFWWVGVGPKKSNVVSLSRTIKLKSNIINFFVYLKKKLIRSTHKTPILYLNLWGQSITSLKTYLYEYIPKLEVLHLAGALIEQLFKGSYLIRKYV